MILFCLLAGLVHAATDSLPQVQTTPKRVAVFKNGLGFVARSGEAKLRDGAAQFDALPTASLGALWITTDDPNKRVLEVSTFADKEKVPVDSVNFQELLRANIGATAIITYSQGGGSANIALAQGEIISVPEDRSAEILSFGCESVFSPAVPPRTLARTGPRGNRDR